MLGLSPIAAGPLADLGVPKKPIAIVLGVEATVEITTSPLVSQAAAVLIGGVSATVSGPTTVNVIIGSYFSLYGLNLTAELQPLPLTGMTRAVAVAGFDLSLENGLAGIPTFVALTGVAASVENGSVVGSFSIAKSISGFELASDTSSVTIAVHQNRDVVGFDLALATGDLGNTPVITEVDGVDLALATGDLANTPVITDVVGFDLALATGDLGNTPVITEVVGVECTAEVQQLSNHPVSTEVVGVSAILNVGLLANTPAIKIVNGVSATAELNRLDNRPGNATKIDGLEHVGQTGVVSILQTANVIISGLGCDATTSAVSISAGHGQAVIGFDAEVEFGTAFVTIIRFPISIGISQSQDVSLSCGNVSAVEVEVVPFATPLPDRLINYAVLTPANSNFAIVNNKTNALR